MARAIFLGLLAANLVFLGFQLVAANDRERRSVSDDLPDIPSLSILTDDDALAMAGTPQNDDTSMPDGSGVRCLSLGPFPDNDAFAEAEAKLAALGLSGKRRLAEGQIWVGYWIFLSPEGSREQAVAKVGALRKLGVGDIYIEPAGERENAISLGVFKERNRAQRRYREIRDLGFEPQIARRTRQGTVYWLDFVPDDSIRVDPADFQTSSGRIVRLATRACSAGGVRIE